MRSQILVLLGVVSLPTFATPTLQCKLSLIATENPVSNPGSRAVAQASKQQNSDTVDLSFGLSGWGCQASATYDETTQTLNITSLSLNYEGDMITSQSAQDHVESRSLSAVRGNDLAACICSPKKLPK